MRGLRIPGRHRVPAFAGACLLAAAAALLAASCGDVGEDKRAGGADAGFRPTSERVQRAGKADRAESTIAAALRPTEPESRTPPDGRPAPAASGPLARFHRALRGLETGARREPVTILHLGDSHIAADRFTGRLREMFQDRFGDAGRGMMMPGFPFAGYRARGVRFDKSGAWTAANSFEGDRGPYGLTGVRLSTEEKGARLALTSEDGPFDWAEATFLAGPGHGSATLAVDGAGRRVNTRAARPELQRVRLERAGRSLALQAAGDGPVTLLSWAVGRNRPGVRYVNLGIPGATADTPRRWKAEFVRADIARLDPDLIVLGYGTNEGFNDRLDASAYGERVAALAARLRDAAPEASLAIIGPADAARLPRFVDERENAPCRALEVSERRDYAALLEAKSSKLARWHAPPKLAGVRRALRRTAEAEGAHFWDWAAFMGGECAVHAWAKARPRLAAADHVHITRAGSRRSARAFHDSLTAGYDAAGKLARHAPGAAGETGSASR